MRSFWLVFPVTSLIGKTFDVRPRDQDYKAGYRRDLTIHQNVITKLDLNMEPTLIILHAD